MISGKTVTWHIVTPSQNEHKLPIDAPDVEWHNVAVKATKHYVI